MPSRKTPKKGPDEISGAAKTQRSAGRRWRSLRRSAILIAVPVGVVLAVAVLQNPSDPEFTLVEVVPGADPEIAALAHEAGDVLKRLVERYPNQVESWSVLGEYYDKFGRRTEAVKCWEKCLELAPGFSQGHFWLGVAAAESGANAEAVASFRKALEGAAGEPQVLVRMGQSLIEMGETEEAISVLKKNLVAYPRSLASFVLLGDIYVQSGQYEKAKQYLEEVIEMQPDYATAYYGLATACAGLDEEEASKRYMEKFKELKVVEEQAHREWLKSGSDLPRVQKNVSKIFTDAAKVFLGQGDVQEAEKLLLRAVDLGPNYPECHQVLAWLYQRQGRIAEALDTLADGCKVNPDDLATHLRLGALLAGEGKFDEAEKAFTEAIRIVPYLGGGYAALARLHLEANRKLDEAQDLIARAVELEPLAKNYYLLALIRQRVGDGPAARDAIERAVSLEPGNPEYRRAYVLIQESKAE